jgi:hypothetical protein
MHRSIRLAEPQGLIEASRQSLRLVRDSVDRVTIRVAQRGTSERSYDTLATLGREKGHSDEHFAEWNDFSLAAATDANPVTRSLQRKCLLDRVAVRTAMSSWASTGLIGQTKEATWATWSST